MAIFENFELTAPPLFRDEKSREGGSYLENLVAKQTLLGITQTKC